MDGGGELLEVEAEAEAGRKLAGGDGDGGKCEYPYVCLPVLARSLRNFLNRECEIPMIGVQG